MKDKPNTTKNQNRSTIARSLRSWIEKIVWQTWEKTAAENGWPKDVIKPEEIKIEHPAEERFGDYSTNIALAIFAKLKVNSEKLKGAIISDKLPKNPIELSHQITKTLKLYQSKALISSVQTAPPGFINLTINTDYFIQQMGEAIQQGDSYGKTDFLAGKKIMVEYTDPNLFKEFHIGHLTTNLIGESLALIFDANGALVKRANYQGDVGMHVAKAVWGMMEKLKAESYTRLPDGQGLKAIRQKLAEIEKKEIKERTHWLGECYALGAKVYEEDKTKAEEIKDINYYVYLAGQEYQKQKEGRKPQANYQQHVQYQKEEFELVKELYFKGREWSLAYFETIYRRLGTKFDYYFFESVVGEYGHKIVSEYLKKGVFQKSQGAIVYSGEKEGMHTRVFINSFGLPTYEAKDLGLADVKYQQYPYDYSFNIVGSEIGAYFKVVLAALKKINPALAEKTTPLIHGMVRRPEGKMSSRTGNVFTVDSLIEEVKVQAKKVIEKAITSKITESEMDTITEMIAIGAIRYVWLKSGVSKDIVFDVEKSVSLTGNSGPYLQYTFARANSVLEKFQSSNSKFQANPKLKFSKSKTISYQLSVNSYKPNTEELTEKGYSLEHSKEYPFCNREELAILRWTYRFPEVVRQAAEEYAPNVICAYLYELAQRFNTFYNKHRIIQAQSSKLKAQNDNLKLDNCKFNENLKLKIENYSQTSNSQFDNSQSANSQFDNSQLDNSQFDNCRFRLALTAATAQILKNGLYLLGITTPQKM